MLAGAQTGLLSGSATVSDPLAPRHVLQAHAEIGTIRIGELPHHPIQIGDIDVHLEPGARSPIGRSIAVRCPLSVARRQAHARGSFAPQPDVPGLAVRRAAGRAALKTQQRPRNCGRSRATSEAYTMGNALETVGCSCSPMLTAVLDRGTRPRVHVPGHIGKSYEAGAVRNGRCATGRDDRTSWWPEIARGARNPAPRSAADLPGMSRAAPARGIPQAQAVGASVLLGQARRLSRAQRTISTCSCDIA